MKGIQYNYIENNNTNIKTELIVAGGMVAVTLISATILSSVRVNADTDTVDEVSITVPSACTMSGNITTGNEHTASINPNTYQDNIGKTTITTFCNDAGGYAIYAIGYTGDKYDGEDHTKLIGTNTNQKISTGTAKTGTSQWAMRITPVTGTYAPTIENSYDSENYHIVPDTYEKVATYGNSTDATGGTGSSIETTYAAYISGTQAADTYTGKVKYTLVHPSVAAAPELPVAPEETATLADGLFVCDMMINLSGDPTECIGEDLENSTRNTTIKAIRMASSLPDNFVVSANNTVSDENSYNPIYIFFDNTDDAGIMYFYTPARKIYMNEYSGVMFGNLNALADITGVSNWDTSMVTDMSGMFNKNLPNSTSQIPATIDLSPLANWDTSSVTNMSGMFAGDESLNNISALSSWDTSSVTNMANMFDGDESLNNISALSSWDTKLVEDMSYMFHHNTSLTDISALSNWDTSSVTYMAGMFASDASLNNISALSNWNTSSVTSMSSMFDYNTSLTDISALSNWNTSSVKYMSSMFSYNRSLTDISALSNWNTSSVTSMSSMFAGDKLLNNISALSNWNTSSVTSMSSMFYYNTALTDISALSNWNTSSVTSMTSMFYGANNIDATILNGWNISNVTYKNNMFTCPADKRPNWY